MTQPDGSILIRECQDLDELEACVQLQRAIWGFDQQDVIPCRAFVVARNIGGQVIGAFDVLRPGAAPTGDACSLIGFAMALPGVAGGKPYLHSHMLGVQPDYRNRGIGRRLKLWQRRDALDRGMQKMEWTFDPLEIKNSFINVQKLGAIARRYVPNLYGVSSSSLQGSLPTDRLYAEWWMESPRVKTVLEGEPVSASPPEEFIIVPRRIGEWKQSLPERVRALEVQQENRQRFERAFADGLAVVGFAIDREGNGIFELGRWEGPPEDPGHLNSPESSGYS